MVVRRYFDFSLICAVVIVSGQAHAARETRSCGETAFNQVTKISNQISPILTEAGYLSPGRRPPPIRTAAIYGDSVPRKLIEGQNTLAYPMSAIGYLGSKCTAFRISECHILSAAHCVYDEKGLRIESSDAFADAATIDVARKTNQKKTLTGEGPIIWNPFQGSYEQNYGLDWQVGRLPGRSGRRTGYFGLLAGSPSGILGTTKSHRPHNLQDYRCEDPLADHITGYSTDLGSPKQNFPPLSDDPKIDMVRFEQSNSLLRSRAATFRGSSGGPVWWCPSDGVAYATGINTRAYYNGDSQLSLPKDESDKLSVAVSISSIFNDIDKFMRENPCDP